ncbi:MAG TPA: FlgD immunoglobulin-like domain containing protein [Polyangiaceae bacterium]|nr:FlgD immunoglobulin-like domain containing protein [Polyangiaceae bacterium]
MVDPVSSSGAASGGFAEALGANKSLGKEAFLKLLVAQLKHQDPLKPQDDSAFVAELAQFSSLEQTMGINDRLDLLSAQSQGLQNSQVTSLVGKLATVRGSLITSEGKGVGVPVAFSLDTAADKTVVTIRDQGGNTVRTIDLGERADGLTQITWDGRDDAGNIQPAGTYSVAVQATNESGSPVVVSQETKGTVQAVSFDKGYPVLHLSTGVSVPVADLLQVDSPPNTSKP